MKISVDKTKPVIEAKPGDIAFFDNDYWLIMWTDNHYYFISLTRANHYRNVSWWIDYSLLTSYLEEVKAVVYDGSESSLNLVIKKPI